MKQRQKVSIAVCAVTAWLYGCSGSINDTQTQNTEAPGVAEPKGSDTTVPLADGSVATPPLRLLTTSQYRATLETLFPFMDEIDLDLEQDVELNGLRAIGASTLALSPRATELYDQNAETIAIRAFESTESATSVMGCAVLSDDCVDRFISDFGRRAYRRTLTEQETSRYLALYQQGVSEFSDQLLAMRYVTMAFLTSPHFLYRVEIGNPDPNEPTQRILSSEEIASKLAYFLWNAPPDPVLLDQGSAGLLSDANELAVQTERLMASPRFKTGVASLFEDYLSLEYLRSIEKLSADYPAFTPSLADAMRQETLLSVGRVALENFDFRELFTSRTTFVNTELAELYGIAGVDSESFEKVELPINSPRVGLLGNASLLSLHAHSHASSPTRRGKFVREMLLCQTMPAPPPDVDAQLPDISADATTRERVSQHATDPSCAGCHRLMDPIGLGLENFDAIGAYRAEENGNAIDASGELDGVAFTGPEGLAEALSQHKNVADCLTRAVFRYAWGRLETSSDEDLLSRVVADFITSGYKLRAMIQSAITQPGFVRPSTSESE